MMRLWEWLRQRAMRKPVVYIMPTQAGLWFLGTQMVLLVMGLGYSNNLCLALEFILLALTAVFMLEAHFNLDGLKVSEFSSTDTVAGGRCHFSFLASQKRPRARHHIQLRLPKKIPASMDWTVMINTSGPSRAEGEVWQRGRYKLDHICLTSTFPLGLFRTWSYHKLTAEVWVYPRQVTFLGEQIYAWAHSDDEQSDQLVQEEDELQEFKMADESTPLHRIAWKLYPRTQTLLKRHMASEDSGVRLFSWPFGLGKESELELLAAAIRFCEENKHNWIYRDHQQETLSGSERAYLQTMRRLATVEIPP